MRTIRYCTFETNSSSTHSITLDTANYSNVQIPKTVTIEPSTFGWEFDRFNDFIRKASYFWTLAQYDDDVKERMLRLSAEHGFDLIWPSLDNGWSSGSYIDHGSEHYHDWLKEFPEIGSDEGLWKFLTSESYWIMLGNDNSSAPMNWKDTPKAAAALPYTILLAATDYENDYISFDYSVKVNTLNIADHVDTVYDLVYNLLESEYSETSRNRQFTRVKFDTDTMLVSVEYFTYDYKTKTETVVKTRKIRVDIHKH